MAGGLYPESKDGHVYGLSPPLVLPHGLDALLEEGVVAARGEPAGQLDVVVERPEVLHRGECDDLPLVLLPLLCLIVLEEPQCPRVLEINPYYNIDS